MPPGGPKFKVSDAGDAGREDTEVDCLPVRTVQTGSFRFVLVVFCCYGTYQGPVCLRRKSYPPLLSVPWDSDPHTVPVPVRTGVRLREGPRL